MGITDGRIVAVDDSLSEKAARSSGLTTYGLTPGCVADLVLIQANSVDEAIAAAPPSGTLIKHGRVVGRSPPS